MASINVINDVDKLYQDALIESDDGYKCNVCGKVYKKLKSAQDHISKQDCYNALDLFKNTQNEVGGFKLFRDVLSRLNPSARISITIFRRSPSYGLCVKTFIFCNINGLSEQMMLEYAVWLETRKKVKTLNGIMTYIKNENNLKDFRCFCRINHEILINSKPYLRKYEDELKTDSLFLVRSLEKALISIHYLLNNTDWFTDSFVESLPLEYQERIMAIVDEVCE